MDSLSDVSVLLLLLDKLSLLEIGTVILSIGKTVTVVFMVSLVKRQKSLVVELNTSLTLC